MEMEKREKLPCGRCLEVWTLQGNIWKKASRLVGVSHSMLAKGLYRTIITIEMPLFEFFSID